MKGWIPVAEEYDWEANNENVAQSISDAAAARKKVADARREYDLLAIMGNQTQAAAAIVVELPESGGGLPEPALVDVLDVDGEARVAAFGRAERFAEFAVKMWGLPTLAPCWRLHEDVVLDLHHLEAAWVAAHRSADWATPTAYRRITIPGYIELWKQSPMAYCRGGHVEPALAPEVITGQRRSHYGNPEAISTIQYPQTDASGNPWGHDYNTTPNKV
jgi:hypothetical protein